MKTLLLFTFLLFFTICISAKESDKYAVSNIPAALLKNANAVVRDFDENIEIVSLDEVNITYKYSITILKKDADRFTAVSESYDKLFDEVDDISGTLYDKSGKKIRALKKIDIIDVAPYGIYLVFSNIRVKHFDFKYSDYPFTVSFEIKRSHKETFRLPDFCPQLYDKHCAVEKASMEISYPADLPVRYKSFHLKEEPIKASAGERKTLTFSVSNIAAEKDIELEPQDAHSLPSAIFACDEFEFGGLHGKMDSWKSFGKFVYDLNANRNDLSEEMQKKVHALTDTCKGSFSKIKLLYEYLQKSTRYIAVEMGIGGWQCVDAQFVSANKYADCKGLSNYMSSMLKETGMNSYGVLIYGGSDDRLKLQRDFTISAFNHYILCVPLDKDTVWMDCTSKADPVGYLPDFTNDRDALLLTPDGGFVVRTPVYALKENRAVRKSDIHINKNDNFNAVIKLYYTGYLNDEEARSVTDRSKDEIENHFNNKFSLGEYKVTGYTIRKDFTDRVPALYEELSLMGAGKVSHSGKRTFIDMSTLPLNVPVMSEAEKRSCPFELNATFSVSDTERIIIDGVYSAEYIPEEIKLNYAFASYSYKIIFDNENQLMIVRSFTQKKGVYPAEMANDYVALTKAINAIRKQVVLLKKE